MPVVEKLQTFNAWGTISVSDKKITVLLSAIDKNGTPYHRTFAAESAESVPDGTALIAVSIADDGYAVQAHEVGKNEINKNQEVAKVLTHTVDWIRKSL
jgi:hypothetical protein